MKKKKYNESYEGFITIVCQFLGGFLIIIGAGLMKESIALAIILATYGLTVATSRTAIHMRYFND